MLCTASKTYQLRAISISNSCLVVTGPSLSASDNTEENVVVVRDQVQRILELAPIPPKLDRLRGLLRGHEYDEDHDLYDEQEDEAENDDDERPVRAISVLNYSGSNSRLR